MRQQKLEERVRLALGELGATWEDPELVVNNVLEIIQEAVAVENWRCKKIVEDYGGKMLELQDSAIGKAHDDSKIMLVYDLQSRLVAVEHILQALTTTKTDKQEQP